MEVIFFQPLVGDVDYVTLRFNRISLTYKKNIVDLNFLMFVL